MFRFLRTLPRLIGYVALAGYFAVCALILAARYWFLPNIDHWRPAMTQYLSARFGVDVQAGHIEADWKGLNPRIVLTGVSLSPPSGGQPDTAATDTVAAPATLDIPYVGAQLEWRSLLMRKPAFVNLEASGIRLDIRRDAQGRYHALGQTFEPDFSGERGGLLGEFLTWLQAQQHIALHNVALRWSDEMRDAPALVLDNVELALGHQGAARSFTLAAQLPPELGQAIDVRAVLDASGMTKLASEAGNAARHDAQAVAAGNPPGAQETGGLAQGASATPTGIDGQIYVSVSQLRPQALSPWMDLPPALAVEQMSAQARLDLHGGRPVTLTTLLTLAQGNWHPDHGTQVAADYLQLYLSGPAADYQQVFRYRGKQQGSESAELSADNPAMAPWDARHALKPPRRARMLPDAVGRPDDAGLAYRVHAQGLKVTADYLFNHALDLGTVVAQGRARQPEYGRLEVDVGQAHLANTDAQVSVSGSWHQGGSTSAGVVSLTGQVQRASIAAIDHYLPEHINEHASHWLEYGLLGGELRNASLVLQGDLAHFPFQEQPQAGDFRIAGPYVDGIIDYLPAHNGEPGWPRLESMQGTAELHRADLRLTADTAVTRPTPQTVINLTGVQARIPNLENAPVLSVKGDTRAGAAAYLALMAHSPLGALLDHVFDDARADGDWQVPLSLTIPLTHGHDTQVDGSILFSGNTVALMPDMPALSNTRGKLLFTHEGAAAQNLKGSFLGGEMSLSGQLGGQGKGLRMQGRLDAGALARYANVDGMRRLTGSIPYDALLAHAQGKPFSLRITSDLKGLAADLPAPLGKQAQQALPLLAVWSGVPGQQDRQLSVKLGDFAQILLEHKASFPGRPFFPCGRRGDQSAGAFA